MRYFSILAVMVIGSMAGAASAEQVLADKGAKIEQMDLRELRLSDAARVLSQQTGLNLVASADAGKVPVTIFLRDVTAKAAIEALCKSHNLWFKEDPESGIIRIMTTQEFQRDLVSFREEQTEVFTLMYPNAVSISFAIRNLFGDRVQLSLDQGENNDDQLDLQSRFDRFDVVDQRRSDYGLGQVSGNSTTLVGGGSYSTTTPLGGSISNLGQAASAVAGATQTRRTDQTQARSQYLGDEFNNFTPEQAQAVQKLLTNGASTTEAQAVLETFRKQSRNIFVTVNRRNNLVAVRTSDQSALEEIRAIVRRLDVQTATVLLEVKILSVTLSDGFNSAFDWQFSDGVTSAGGFSTGDIQPPAADTLKGAARRAAPLTLGGAGIAGNNLIYQFVNNNFRARIQLLESKNKVTTLATPMILTANNEVSRLFIGEDRPIVQSITSQTTTTQGVTTSTPISQFQIVPVGTTLLITPNINSDRTVTLRLLQVNSSIEPGAATIPIVTSSGAVQQQPVDVVATQTVSGTIVAKDNLELAVGGLISDSVSDQRAQVPLLGKIPGIGIFFRRQQTARSKSELIVVIRPHIISTPAESEGLSQKLLGELSIHPNAPDAKGTLPTFTPREVLRPNPPKNLKETILKQENVKQDE